MVINPEFGDKSLHGMRTILRDILLIFFNNRNGISVIKTFGGL